MKTKLMSGFFVLGLATGLAHNAWAAREVYETVDGCSNSKFACDHSVPGSGVKWGGGSSGFSATDPPVVGKCWDLNELGVCVNHFITGFPDPAPNHTICDGRPTCQTK
jgi:hypothetical protein